MLVEPETRSQEETKSVKDEPTYGQDLWDSLNAVREATEHRSKTMQSLKNFFKSYRKCLD